MPYYSADMTQCAACLQKQPLHAGIKGAVAYGDVAKQVALRLKYGGRIGLATIVANALRRYLDDVPNNALIAPVPLHWTRLWWRTYNQSGLIARELQKGSSARLIPDLLIRTRRTPFLRSADPHERARAVKGAFAVNRKWIEALKDVPILLVDDVYTSGATTNACIRALQKAGAGPVTILCWARVLPLALEN